MSAAESSAVLPERIILPRCHAEFPADAAQGFLDLLDDVGLDAFGGFVEEQEFGLAGQRAADRKLLLLAAR